MQEVATSSVLDTTAGELVLRLHGSSHHGQTVRLRSAKCTVGSDTSCTLKLAGPGIAPVHCLILRGPAGAIVRRWSADTRLNGRSFHESLLAAGDRLSIGPVELEVLATDAPNDRRPSNEQAASAAPRIERQALQQERDQIQRERQEVEKQRAELDERREEMAAAMRELRTRQYEHETKLAEQWERLDAERKLWRPKVDAELARLSNDRTQFDQQRAAWEAAREAERRSLRQELDDRADELSTESSRIEAEWRTLTSERNDFETWCRDQRDSLSSAEAALVRNQQEHESRLAAARQTAIQQDTARVRMLVESLDAAEAAQLRTQEELATTRGGLTELETQLAQERAALAAARAELAAAGLQAQVSLAELRESFESKLAAMGNDLGATQARLAAEQDELAAARRELAEARQTFEQEIAAARQHVAEQESQAEMRRQDLQVREQSLSEQLQALTERETRLAEAQKETGLRHEQDEHHRAEAEASFEQRSAALAAEQARLNELDQALAARQATANERDQALATRQAEADERDRALAARKAELESKAESLEQRQRELQDSIDRFEAEQKRQAEPQITTSAPAQSPQPTEPVAEPAETAHTEAGAEPEPARRGGSIDLNEIFRRVGMNVPNDENEPEPAPPTTPAPVAPAMPTHNPAVAAPTPAPVARTGHASPAHAGDDEDSVEQYMAKLLERVRSPGARAEPTPAPTGAVAPKAEPAPVPEERPLPPAPLESMEDLSPRTVAPERSVDLSAMRELANMQAKTAIQTHSQRKTVSAVRSKFIVAVLALCCGGALTVLYWKLPNEVTLYGIGGAFVTAVVWLLQYFFLLAKLVLQRMRNRAPEHDDEPEAEAMPCRDDADREPPRADTVESMLGDLTSR